MIHTEDYKYYRCSFSTFNKAQEAVLPYFDKDVNLVVSLKTATGKTAIAECIFGYHLYNNQSSKVIYVSPYKSISFEKRVDWYGNGQFSQYGILLNTGDTKVSLEEYDTNRILIMTSESLDCQLRNCSKDGWISNVDCIVFDEAHLLGRERRGTSVESALMNFTKLNSKARVVLLSATVSNGKQIAQWIKSLNQKQTKYIWSNWRPVDIEYVYYEFDDSDLYTREKKKVERAIGVIANRGIGEKVIVFVHSKKTGKMLLNRISNMGIRCAFHNASLSFSSRKHIEAEFNGAYSGLDVIISTSTLAFGVNLG